MRLAILSVLVAAIIAIECSHTFLGTNVQRPLAYHREVKYDSKMFRKTVEYFNYTMPSQIYHRPTIQGILAIDKVSSSTASANVTAGGLGYTFVSLRMKSDRGRKLDYDIYIYA